MDEKIELTKRQEEILNFIKKYYFLAIILCALS